MAPATTVDGSDYREQIHRDGFAIVEDVVCSSRVEQLRAAICEIPAGEEVRRRANVYGIRHLLDLSPACRELATSAAMRALVTPILGDGCFAVRGTFFDKVPGANWNLRWHQDSVIAVKQRHDVPGFHAWSVKAGVVQVRPPVAILENMLAIRVHLDDCNADNGALRILKGSHHQRWQRDQLDDAKAQFDTVTCEVPSGGVLAMRPLALHASSPSQSTAHRRVIHLEYATAQLSDGLEWHTRL